MKAKRLSYNSFEFLQKLVQKELDLHGAKFEYVKSLPEGRMPNGEWWFHHYVFETQEQYEEWKRFCITELRNSRERLSRKKAEDVFRWIDLQWGLKHQFEHDNLV